MTTRVRAARADDEGPVVALLDAASLEAEFVPDQFLVAEEDADIVACARMKPLVDGTHELASVAVRADLRGQRIGERVVRAALERARGPVHALALAPGFFARLGFARVPDVPAPLAEKAGGMCASTGFVPMTLRAPEAAGEA